MSIASRIPWSKIVSGVALTALALLLAKNVTAGPPNVPREKDVQKAQREEPVLKGNDERIASPSAGAVGGNGVIEPADRETKVAASASGRINAILVKEGDAVESGAVLAELESSVEKAALDAAEAEIVVTQADVGRTQHGLRKEDIDAAVAESEAAKARADLSSGSLARIEKIAKGGAATPDELDRAKRQADVDERTFRATEARRLAAQRGGRWDDVLVSQAKVKAAIARRDQARASLEKLTIRAPLKGTILQVKVRAGEYYSPGSAEPLVVMGDTTKLRVRMDVDERDIAKVKIGARAHAEPSAFVGKRFDGKVVEIGRRMGRKNIRTDDPTERIDTKILEVVFELDAPDGLVPGLRVMSYIDAP